MTRFRYQSFGLILITVSLALIGCERVNSELRIPDGRDGRQPLTNEKPRCQWALQESCWVKNMRIIQSCLNQAATSSPDRFFDDRSLCANEHGKVIDFNRPVGNELTLSRRYRGPLDFQVYQHGTTCFRFKGDASEFAIETNQGSLAYKKTAAGITATCFDGEPIQIVPQLLTQDCELTDQDFRNLIPGVVFEPMEDEGQWLGWSFSFTGIGPNQPPIFTCHF